MIIVSNTTPIRYLSKIEKADILKELFGRVIIPEKVAEELQQEGTPQAVRVWVWNSPAWLEVKKADISLFTPRLAIHNGEREAIALALELKANALLIDDKNGRMEAERAGLLVVPTLAILDQAAEKGLIELPEIIKSLRETTFRAKDALFVQMLERDRQRKAHDKTLATPTQEPDRNR